jgi:hypothetical protein
VPGVEHLHLVAAFMHPGGGRCTAIKICADLDIYFERNVAKEVA